MPRTKKEPPLKSFRVTKESAFVLVAIISCLLIAFTSYLFGFNRGLEQTRNIVIEGVSDAETPVVESKGEGIDFSTFWEAWDLLQAKYPNIEKLSEKDLIYGAIKGLTEALNDRNTTFFTPEESKKFNEDINGSFSGIGAEIAIRDGQLLIVAPLKESPAEKAGLQPEDKVLAIDGVPTTDISIDEATRKVRGEVGSMIVLKIRREGVATDMDIPIVRSDIQVPTIDTDMIGKEHDILHVQVYNFNNNLSSLFYRAVIRPKLSIPKAIILDLRNNPGGFLDEAVSLAGWFLNKGETVAIERFASGNEQVFKVKGDGDLREIPLVVLVNGGSASASEIVAGALRVNRGVQLVGETTFGKGTVQQLKDLKDGSSLKVTIANWLLPDSTLIEGNGLVPNYVVPITDEDILSGKDPQLDKALELIEQPAKPA